MARRSSRAVAVDDTESDAESVRLFHQEISEAGDRFVHRLPDHVQSDSDPSRGLQIDVHSTVAVGAIPNGAPSFRFCAHTFAAHVIRLVAAHSRWFSLGGQSSTTMACQSRWDRRLGGFSPGRTDVAPGVESDPPSIESMAGGLRTGRHRSPLCSHTSARGSSASSMDSSISVARRAADRPNFVASRRRNVLLAAGGPTPRPRQLPFPTTTRRMLHS